jgi:enoyl-CoA hydratase
MSAEALKLEHKGQAAWITIDRPDRGNMLDVAMLRRLAALIAEASAGAHAVVLQGAGDNFCLGRDAGARSGAKPSAMELRDRVITPILDLYAAVRSAPVPVVARVQGSAIGLGCALAAVCDITIAGTNARFRLPEMEKNLPPTLAISALLDRVGSKAVTWLVYSMEEIDARRALEIGLVSDVAPADALDAAVTRLLGTLTARSLISVRAVKEYIAHAPTTGPAVAPLAANLLAAAMSSQD